MKVWKLKKLKGVNMKYKKACTACKYNCCSYKPNVYTVEYI